MNVQLDLHRKKKNRCIAFLVFLVKNKMPQVNVNVTSAQKVNFKEVLKVLLVIIAPKVILPTNRDSFNVFYAYQDNTKTKKVKKSALIVLLEHIKMSPKVHFAKIVLKDVSLMMVVVWLIV